MAYKCKIFVAVTEHFMEIKTCIDGHVCMISKVIAKKYGKGNMSVKYEIHKWS